MAMYHLLEEPRPIDGGISFTVDALEVGQTIFVTNAALTQLAPHAVGGKAALQCVMMNISLLAECALAKVRSPMLAQLIVLDADDVAAIAPDILAPSPAGEHEAG